MMMRLKQSFNDFGMRQLVKWGSICVILLLTGSIYFLFFTSDGHYIYCLMNESSWANARTKTELESRILKFKSFPITPNQSLWGKNYTLGMDERMTQYWILNDQECPLDVVYAKDDKIRMIFTSYE